MELVPKLTRRNAETLRGEITKNSSDIVSAESVLKAARDALDDAVATGENEEAAGNTLSRSRTELERHMARRESLVRALAAAEEREQATKLQALQDEARAITALQAKRRDEYDAAASKTARSLTAWEEEDSKLNRVNRLITDMGGEPIGGPYSNHVRGELHLPAGDGRQYPHRTSQRVDPQVFALGQMLRDAQQK